MFAKLLVQKLPSTYIQQKLPSLKEITACLQTFSCHWCSEPKWAVFYAVHKRQTDSTVFEIIIKRHHIVLQVILEVFFTEDPNSQ